MLQKGSVVKSLCGRDSGRYFVVLEICGDCILLADGKVRKLATPKKKKIRHIQQTTAVLDISSITGDKHLKKMLSSLNNKATASREVN